MENNNTLQTLRKKCEFDALKQNGKRLYPSDWLFVVYSANNNQGFRIGLTLPKYVGKAVVRNKIRRRLKEYFKKADTTHWNIDINVIFRKKPPVFYKDLSYKEMEKVLDKTIKLFSKFV